MGIAVLPSQLLLTNKFNRKRQDECITIGLREESMESKAVSSASS